MVLSVITLVFKRVCPCMCLYSAPPLNKPSQDKNNSFTQVERLKYIQLQFVLPRIYSSQLTLCHRIYRQFCVLSQYKVQLSHTEGESSKVTVFYYRISSLCCEQHIGWCRPCVKVCFPFVYCFSVCFLQGWDQGTFGLNISIVGDTGWGKHWIQVQVK